MRSRSTAFALALLAGCTTVLVDVPELQIGPAAPTSAEPLTASLSGETADDTRWTVAWLRDGTRVLSLDGALQVPATETARDQRWQAVIVDRFDGGAVVGTSNELIIANSPPVLSQATIDPEEPGSDEALTVLVGWSDADGDPQDLAVQWLIDGVEVASSLTLPIGTHRRGDVVTAVVTPRDPVTDGAPVTTAPVTVGNGAPDGLVAGILPSAPTPSDPLQCVVATPAVDPDDDVLTYTVSWFLDGLAYPAALPGATGPVTTTLADDTIPAADTADGQSWSCRVAVNDGFEDGEPATATAFVSAGPAPDFAIDDVNTTSATFDQVVSPRDYLEKVSGWYFGHAT